MGNGTLDANWPACVGCAVLSRSLERTKTKVPDICTKCFSDYCWNGTVKSEKPSTPYAPELILPNFKAKTSGAAGGPGGAGSGKVKGGAAGGRMVSAGLLALTGLSSLFWLL